MPDMRRCPCAAQRQACQRQPEVRLQGLRQDVLHQEEHDIQRHAQERVGVEGVPAVHVGGPVAGQDGGALRHHARDGFRVEAQGAGRDRRCAEGYGTDGHRGGRRGFLAGLVQGRQEGVRRRRVRSQAEEAGRRQPQARAVGRAGLPAVRRRPQGQGHRQGGQAGQVLCCRRQGRPWRPRVRQGHALHGRRGLVPQVLEGQRQRAGADQGRQGHGEGNLPHTAPQRLPLQAEGLPRLVQGRVHQVPQQLPDLEQRNGSRTQPGGKGHGTDGHCRFSIVLRDLRFHTRQAAFANSCGKTVEK